MSILLFTQQASAQNLDYLKDIKPILKTHCVSCHGPIKSEASLRLDTFAHIASGGDNGHALVAAKPQASPIIQRVLSDDRADDRRVGCVRRSGRTELLDQQRQRQLQGYSGGLHL